MYGKESNSNLLNKLKTMNTNISNEKLIQQQKDDYLKKYNILYKICDGALRKDFNFSAY